MSVPGEAREEAGGERPGKRFESCEVRRLVLDDGEVGPGRGDDRQPARSVDHTVRVGSCRGCKVPP